MKVKVIPILVFCVIAVVSATLFWPNSKEEGESQADGSEDSSEESENSDEFLAPIIPSLTLPYPQTEGDNFLDFALKELESRTSIQSRINLKIRMAGETLTGSGSYTEFWDEDSIRFEFDRMYLRWELYLRYIDPDADPEATSADDPAAAGNDEDDDAPELYALLRVRDPAYVWEYRKFGGGEECVYLNLQRIAQTLEDHELNPSITLINAWPELGGLHRVLREFRKHYEFAEEVEPAFLPGDSPEPIWLLTGRRRRNEDDVEPTMGPIPMPNHISIAFGRQNYFPYRIEFLYDPTPSNREESNEEDSDSLNSMLVVEFWEVALDGAISKDRFLFSPSSLPSSNEHGPRLVDRTEEFLKEYDLMAE